MTTLPIEATRTASKDLPLEKAVAEAMAEEMGKSHVWDQGFESMLPSEQHAKKAELAKTPEAAKALHEHYLKGLKDPSKSTKKPEDFLEKSDKGDGKSEAASVSEALKDSGLPKSIIDGAKPVSEKEADEWQAKAKAQVESPEGQKALDDVEKALDSEHYDDRDTLALIGGLGSTFAIGGSGLIATGIAGLGGTIGLAALPVMVGVIAAGAIAGAIVGEVSDRRRKKEREAEAGGTKKTAKDTRKELERILTAPTMKDVEAAAPFIDDKGKLDMAKLDKALKDGKTASRSDLLPSEQHAFKFASQQEAEKLEAEAEANEQQAQADRAKAEAAQMRQAAQASGLYGYTKGTQRDVEASVRKAQRRANSIAKVLYARDERSVDFLKAHAKRANSKSARLILAAMKNIGPRVASDKTAGPKLTSDQIAEIKGEMVKSGVPVRFMKGGGSLNIETGHVSPRGVNVIHQIVYWNFTKETAKKIADWLGARASFDKSAALLPSERHASIFHGSEKEQLEYVVDALRLAGKQGLRVDGLPRKGALAAQSKGFAEAERGQLFITSKGKSVRLASEEKVAGGLYGHPTKTARLALVACSDLRAYVGEVAFSLHSRRTAKYAKMTGFLKEHGKTARCAYSRMILSCYPDAPVVKAASSKIPASEMLKKAFVPDSVDGWVEWADGTRTAAKEPSEEDRIKQLEQIAEAMRTYLGRGHFSDPLTNGSLRGIEKQIKALKSKKATTRRRG